MTATGRCRRKKTAPTATTSPPCTGTMRPPQPAAAPATPPTRPRPWTPASGARSSGGFYSYDHGHLLLWQEWTNPEDRPLWDRRDELVAKYGEGDGQLHDQHLPEPLPVPECVHHGPVLLADPPLPAHLRGPDRGNDLLHRTQGRDRRRTGPSASASTRTSSTPPAWPLPTTSRSSGPATRPIGPPRRPLERHDPRVHGMRSPAPTSRPRRWA